MCLGSAAVARELARSSLVAIQFPPFVQSPVCEPTAEAADQHRAFRLPGAACAE
jgi:hypothetical protein